MAYILGGGLKLLEVTMDKLFYDIVEIDRDEPPWSEDLFFLGFDPVYLKLRKFRDVVDEVKHNLDNGNVKWSLLQHLPSLIKAEDDLVKAEEEASCIVGIIAKKSWRIYTKDDSENGKK